MLKFFFIFFLVLGSCQFFKDDGKTEMDEEEYFYSSRKDGDLWRVPLMRPYEMVSTLGSNSTDWFLIVDNPNITGPEYEQFGKEFQFTGVYQVGIKDSIIRLDNEDEHWPKLGASFPTTVLINAKTHILFIARTEEDKKEIDTQLKTWNAEGMKMYFWDKVRDDYQEQGKLPAEW